MAGAKLKWIPIEKGLFGNTITSYAKVRGGWLVRMWNGSGLALTFIADPEHSHPPTPVE